MLTGNCFKLDDQTTQVGRCKNPTTFLVHGIRWKFEKFVGGGKDDLGPSTVFWKTVLIGI